MAACNSELGHAKFDHFARGWDFKVERHERALHAKLGLELFRLLLGRTLR
jgi:hypothetical protein